MILECRRDKSLSAETVAARLTCLVDKLRSFPIVINFKLPRGATYLVTLEQFFFLSYLSYIILSYHTTTPFREERPRYGSDHVNVALRRLCSTDLSGQRGPTPIVPYLEASKWGRATIAEHGPTDSDMTNRTNRSPQPKFKINQKYFHKIMHE